jgi:diguanylate cyclase (GGDEF)-like protein
MDDTQTIALEKCEVTLFQDLEQSTRPCLILYSGGEPGRRWDLDSGLHVLGRASDAQVRVEGVGISRRHAEIQVVDGQATLRDLGSANCTHLNDHRVERPSLLADGDFVRLATTVFRFHAHRSVDVLLHDRLYRRATTDPGTGAFNRRFLHDLLRMEVPRARRSGRPLTVLACDLDHFKSVNDRFGHAAGDQVLRECVQRLRTQLRAGDALCRAGGEEFAIVLPDCGYSEGLQLAERLRACLPAEPMWLPQIDPRPAKGRTASRGPDSPPRAGRDAPGRPPAGPPADAGGRRLEHRQTVSIGVAQLGQGIESGESLLEAADRQLYLAKHNGRNRVE